MRKSYKVLIAATVASVSSIGSAYLFGFQKNENKVLASWTTSYEPSVKWNSNWDHRDPASLIKPKRHHSTSSLKNLDEKDQKKESTDDFEINKHSSKATRHLFLVRHGQYEINAASSSLQILTKLGEEQAEMTGNRLKELATKFKFTHIHNSTMIRAIQTSDLIKKKISLEGVQIKSPDPLLSEGAPIPPEPPVGHWKPEVYQFYEDGSRIEAAFRKYFHRAPPEQLDDSYEIIVCHANVIRYFFCRALQFPPEAWLRFGLSHGSITYITIRPDGRVGCKCLGEAGYMPVEKITF